MKTLKHSVLILLFLLGAVNCQKDNFGKNYSTLLDPISSQKYYASEILDENHIAINGIWKVTGTSGGIAGSGYTPDFNYLIIKPNGIFGIVRNDSLITTGKILIKNQSVSELYVDLIADTDPGKMGIGIVLDSDKYIELHSDTLDLIAPCCDRFNTQLKRVQ